MGLRNMLHKVRPGVPGEQFVSPGAGDHSQLAGLELEGVGGECGGLLRALLVGNVCSTCCCLNGGELAFEGRCVMNEGGGGRVGEAAKLWGGWCSAKHY